MKWNKFRLKTTTEAEDIVSSMLMDLGIQGVEIEDKIPLTQSDKEQMFVDILPQTEADDGVAYLSFYLEPEEDKEKILSDVRKELEEMSAYVNVGECLIEESETEDVDWVNNWKQYFHQFYVDDVLIIPSWEEVKPEDEDKMIIHIDPGTAFGTGMHETTQLCIRQIRKYVTENTKILDVGCGSGILGMLALKFGAKYSVGTDLDPCAIDATHENMEVNGISKDRYEVMIGNIIDDKEVQDAAGYDKYDIVTANILAHNYDLEGARAYFEELKTIGPDALIISDPGMFTIAKEVMPDTDIHISTQANNTNYMTYQFWWKQGAKRVVTARELSLNEIKGIRAHIPDDMEIETFIHGAMCISYSGRCLLSSFMAGRDANRGACTHPCRWKYSVVEESRPGEYMPVYENERGTYIFNSKDLCMIEHIPELIEAGIDSFKIEGRMKTALYVATVARTYRLAIDEFLQDPELYKSRIPFYKSEIQKCTYRQYTTGFFFGKPDENTQIYDSNTYVKEYTYLGIVGECNDKGLYHIEQRNKFSVGETIEVMRPDGTNLEVTVKAIYNEDGEAMESAPHPKQQLYIDLGVPLCQYDILRRKED